MEKHSNTCQSSHHRSHQPTNDDDDEPIATKHLMKQKKKRAISSAGDEGCCNTDDRNTLSTTCNLSPSQTARITESFNHSLIACVVGRRIGGQHLADRLHRLFRLTGSLAVTELGRGYFVLKFSESADCKEALEGCPWSIPNVCISLFPWIPNFKPSEAAITHFDVWVRFPELCIEYYDKEVLQQMAAAIGSLVKIDPVTERLEKCKFARLCIKLNLSNPLPSEIKLGKIRQKIEYEGLHFLCSHCRRVGDPKHDCLTNPSGNDTQHRAHPFQHPNCRQSYPICSSSKQPPVPTEPAPSGSRFQALGQDMPSLPLGECETAATSTSSSLPSLDVGPRLAQKKHHFPGLKEAGAAANFNLGNQKEISGVSAQKGAHCHPMSFASKVEAPSTIINASELKEKNLIQSMPLAPSISEPQFSELQFTQQTNPLAAESTHSTTLAFHNNQPQSLIASIASPQSPPISEASLKFYSTGIQHSTIEKEMGSTPSTEVSGKSCPTVYTINPMISKLKIGLSEVQTTMSNQYVTNFTPTTSDGNEYRIGSKAISTSGSKKLLCWNYRGTDNIKLMRALKDLIQLHGPSVVLIFGTKISGVDADQVVQELPFCGSYCRKPDGYSGGIWLLLSREDVQIEVNSLSSQQISASVYFHSKTSKLMLDADIETSSQPWGPNFFFTSSNLIDNNTLAY